MIRSQISLTDLIIQS